VSNGDTDAGVIAHPIGGRLGHDGAPRDHGKRAAGARWPCSRPGYGICSPDTNRRRDSSSFRSRRTSLWLGRPAGPSRRSLKRANHPAQLRSSRERERAPSRGDPARGPSPFRRCLEDGLLFMPRHPRGVSRTSRRADLGSAAAPPARDADGAPSGPLAPRDLHRRADRPRLLRRSSSVAELPALVKRPAALRSRSR
jgi:hypothetical protein